MSTLNVTSIQNPAAPQANISLNADGTVTLPVYTAGVAPALFQAGTLWFDTAGPSLLVRNPGNTAWVSAGGGGGGGTVTGVTGTAPIVSSGGTAPILSITPATSGAAGSMSAADKAKLDGAATIVSSVDVSGGTTGLTYTGGPITGSGTITMAGVLAVANGGTGATTQAAAQANLLPSQAGNPGKLLSTDGAGVLSWVAAGGTGTVTGVTGTLPITVATGTTTPVIAINAATAAAAGSIEIATLAEAATGTDATRASTPETSVPKDASGMAGAALLPGSAAAYGGTSATGMIRYNNSTPPAVIEYYNGSAWVALGGLAAASLAQAAAGTSNAVANTPQTSVPKDASGMTGAALIPGGNDAARPGTPATGMLRYNSQSGTPVSMEYYDGAAWSGFGGGGGSGSVQAWVNFNAKTATPTIRGSGNVSSVTKSGTGIFTVNFTSALASANYSAIANYNDLGTAVGSVNDGQASCYTFATSSVGVLTTNGIANLMDALYCSLTVVL